MTKPSCCLGSCPSVRPSDSKSVSLPRRTRPAPSAHGTGRAGAPHRDRRARHRVAGRRVAARATDGARRAHGQREDDTRPRHRRTHDRIAWLGRVHRRPTHARRPRLGAPGRRRRHVDDPPPRRHTVRLVRRHPAPQQRVRARGTRRRAHTLQGRCGAPHRTRPRIQRRLRAPWRPCRQRLAARGCGAPALGTTTKTAVGQSDSPTVRQYELRREWDAID
jgi:hypothetical protein